jgi:c-di-GMP-related signal transduction protein
MNVLAEGVETPEQLRKLTALGCDCVQGFYLSKPMGQQQTQALMEERNDFIRGFQRLQRSQSDHENGFGRVDWPDAAPLFSAIVSGAR